MCYNIDIPSCSFSDQFFLVHGPRLMEGGALDILQIGMKFKQTNLNPKSSGPDWSSYKKWANKMNKLLFSDFHHPECEKGLKHLIKL